jgi:hypothetical protein
MSNLMIPFEFQCSTTESERERNSNLLCIIRLVVVDSVRRPNKNGKEKLFPSIDFKLEKLFSPAPILFRFSRLFHAFVLVSIKNCVEKLHKFLLELVFAVELKATTMETRDPEAGGAQTSGGLMQQLPERAQ